MPLKMHRVELVALIAMMFATIAISMDAMLPALPQIALDLSPDNPNAAQLVLTSFVLGMGLGTFVTGPLSDTFGRKNVVIGGAAVYCVGAAASIYAQSLEFLLVSRLIQGLGAAGPRVVSLAIIRDQFSGREMARLMSFVMMVFTIFPAVAPSLGAFILIFGEWHAIFAAFLVFSIINVIWFGVRMPETLPVEDRRPFSFRAIWAALLEMIAHPMVRLSIAVQCLVFGMLFAMISSVQQIYDITFDQAENFHLWFFMVALLSGCGSLLNARLVIKLGMRRIINAVIAFQIFASSAMLLVYFSDLGATATFFGFVAWQTSVFFMIGMSIGNLNAIALEPMGHIAGLASSVIGAVSTVAAVMIAAPLGLMFDGTPVPLATGILCLAIIAFALMQAMSRREAEEAAATL